MPRLFTAIEVPEPIRQRLGLIRAPFAGARWIAPQDMHLTLRFFGDIDGRMADEVADFLGGIHARPFSLEIAGLGAFGGRDPHTLWAGVKPSHDLDTLQYANERAARAAGLEPDPRTFKPHVTLARIRGVRERDVATFLQHNGGLATDPFLVTRFALLSARPGTGGPPYAVEAEYPFEGVHAGDDEDYAEHTP
ncbi:MAG: RNA 2',3'-cyclic phosphodiesterase [Hyphomicrobiaceae bacterium]|nr:RNA 2',3'-cyclic phosphodiesterase [Hyphomicrobiaceae bacterium]